MSDGKLGITINGVKYSGWKSVTITESMSTICKSFELQCLNSSVTKNIVPGLPVTIDIDGVTQLTGYIDKRKRVGNSTGHTMSISGRDKTRDLVDCSAIKKSGSWNRSTLQRICEDLCKPFGIKVEIDSGVNASQVFSSVTLQDGESAFSLIEKLCRMRAILPLSTASGNLLLTTTGKELSEDALVDGTNIIEINEDIDYTNRFSDYTVKSQDTGSGNVWKKETVTGIKGTAFDNVIKNILKQYRPLVMHSENRSDASIAKKRAEWEAIVRFSRSLALEITTAGWYQTSGNLWKINKLVDLIYKPFDIDGTFLIGSTSRRLDQSGRTTSLQLFHQNAFVPEPTVLVNKAKNAKNPWAK